ncbi:MAG: restriction endonuclease [Burkholderiaceae bacterium]|nr:restriction endonuclease [Burkholderiaceae bacterium]
MKFAPARNSLFGMLLRARWWVSALVALALGLVAAALLPESLRVAGALSGLPFGVIAVVAAYRQRHLPGAARIEETRRAVAAMGWPAFSALLEQAFQRDGYAVRRGRTEAVDFELERQGRRMLVCARRWKSARTGLDALRPLQAAREAGAVTGATDALYVGLGPLSDSAQSYAGEHGIAVWQAAELARALRGLPLGPAAER